MDGIELTWGNYKSVHQMMERIARRQGFGDVLAEGAMRAAQRIGGEAPNFAVHTMKGNTPRGVEFKQMWPWILDHCVSQGSTNEGMEYVLHPADVGAKAPEGLRLARNFSPEDAVDWNVQCNWSAHFNDSLGVCWFSTNGDFKRLVQALRAATGWDFPAEESVEVGTRIQTLLRVFNLRHGHTAEMDAPSPRIVYIPTEGPGKGKNIMDHWSEMLSKYYEGKGWDKTGKPLPETLKRLGLDSVVKDLWE